ncbi:MAG: hypothetical protein LBT01_03845, partial [Spirochaetaceae bacterium]|nr:hypothetical protein [Spirochaetaceae bacterium]
MCNNFRVLFSAGKPEKSRQTSKISSGIILKKIGKQIVNVPQAVWLFVPAHPQSEVEQSSGIRQNRG